MTFENDLRNYGHQLSSTRKQELFFNHEGRWAIILGVMFLAAAFAVFKLMPEDLFVAIVMWVVSGTTLIIGIRNYAISRKWPYRESTYRIENDRLVLTAPDGQVIEFAPDHLIDIDDTGQWLLFDAHKVPVDGLLNPGYTALDYELCEWLESFPQGHKIVDEIPKRKKDPNAPDNSVIWGIHNTLQSWLSVGVLVPIVAYFFGDEKIFNWVVSLAYIALPLMVLLFAVTFAITRWRTRRFRQSLPNEE
jgi:hypothetical protein